MRYSYDSVISLHIGSTKQSIQLLKKIMFMLVDIEWMARMWDPLILEIKLKLYKYK